MAIQSQNKKTPEKSCSSIRTSIDEKRQFPAVTCHTTFPNHYPTFNPTTLFHLPMETNFAPLLVDLFLHSYEAEVVQELLRKGEKKLA